MWQRFRKSRESRKGKAAPATCELEAASRICGVSTEAGASTIARSTFNANENALAFAEIWPTGFSMSQGHCCRTGNNGAGSFPEGGAAGPSQQQHVVGA